MLLRNGTVIAGKRRMDQARKHSSFLRPNEWLMDCGDFSNGVFAQAISCRKLGKAIRGLKVTNNVVAAKTGISGTKVLEPRELRRIFGI
ncbi:uncharacterized protein [Physcomitrium patens]|uniref:uncharacterized protein isoform X3 n=1 Tax=Physcomitrium patens TaxID=3218 RepID=UPI003CCCDE4D